MIEVHNLTTNPIDEEFLKKVAKKVLEEENKSETELSVALVGPGRMRKLNKKYLGKNRTTDVLSFPDNGFGEIVICPKEVKKNAKRFKSTFEKELALCLIHGLLHLLGYNHEISKEKAKKMEQKQQYYLEICQDLIS